MVDYRARAFYRQTRNNDEPSDGQNQFARGGI
jgi:hypothetical protein